jgi:hypothetical protein
MKILLLGDSHTDIFLRMPEVTRFTTAQCRSPIFTNHRFTDLSESDLWSKLTSWFEQQTVDAKHLVITSGEIDIRAHFWRHIPRHYIKDANEILEFIKTNAEKFYHSLIRIIELYKLENIVVWGQPAAGERAHYNSEVPFTGSSKTRNQIIHLWNREFLKIISQNPKITFTTAFYDFVDPQTYLTTSPNPSHDGVHWHDNFGPIFWENLVMPAMSQGSLVGPNYSIMVNDQFDMSESLSQGQQQYDTWVRADQFHNIDGLGHSVHFKGKTYVWFTADQRHRLPMQYIELSLQKIN